MEINERYQCTTEVMKSKFIAILLPIDNPDNFKKELAKIQKEHSKARHVVYAYRIDGKTKSCDDREPKGTAGRPLLELLMKKDLNSCQVRYGVPSSSMNMHGSMPFTPGIGFSCGTYGPSGLSATATPIALRPSFWCAGK